MALNLKSKLRNNTQSNILYHELEGSHKSEHVKNHQAV